MPIIITFDIQDAPPPDYNRLQSMFERLGWERLGGSAYRYPHTKDLKGVEDWFNHVIPALTILRSYVFHAQEQGRDVRKFTIDVQTSTGYGSESDRQLLPRSGTKIEFHPHTRRDFGEEQLRNSIDSFEWPY